MAKQFKIDDDVRDVLRAATIDANSVKLNGQLDRKLYERVNKVLVGAGGKWNKKAQTHLFPSDPREVLGLAVETGVGRNLQQEMQFYPTPDWIADRVVEYAELEPHHKILEPSAGKGSLLDAVYRRPFEDCPNNGNLVVIVEMETKFCEGLKAKFPCAIVANTDFLKCVPENGKGEFDRVIMNPPFERGSDVTHILHAMRFLKPGGRLVSVCGNGPKQQEKLQGIATHWIELPEGSFKESGTMINTAIVVIDA
jgi:phospholipid N-methyltransferase